MQAPRAHASDASARHPEPSSQLDSSFRARDVQRVSAENARDAATQIISGLSLPARSTERKLQIVTFESDQDCRFFYPQRALEWQRQVNTYMSRALRSEHGIRVQRVVLTPNAYHHARGNREDSPELRREFADSHVRLMR